MPGKTILDLSAEEQEAMLGALRRARYGYLLGMHIVLLSGARKTPSEIAEFLFAHELDIDLLARIGAQWMPKGEQVEIPTPGINQQNYLAGALDLRTDLMTHCVWWSKRAGLFLDLLKRLDDAYSASHFTRLYVVVDNAKIHHTRIVKKWLAAHPRFKLRFLPTYCPRANPIERAFGNDHDNCTRNHKRKRLSDLVAYVLCHSG